MSKSLKNNNLSKYREDLQNKNKKLVERAISYISSLNGDISFSLVSKVTYDIADSLKEEKGITLAGLSKSKIYRPLIEKAQLSQDGKINKKSSLSNTDISMGDIKLQIHTFRVQNINLKLENKILSEQLQILGTPIPELNTIDENMVKKYKYFSEACSNLISRLLELDLVYIDTDKLTLNVQMFDDIVLTKDSLGMLYKDKLNEYRN
jgi:hypothetical protein